MVRDAGTLKAPDIPTQPAHRVHLADLQSTPAAVLAHTRQCGGRAHGSAGRRKPGDGMPWCCSLAFRQRGWRHPAPAKQHNRQGLCLRLQEPILQDDRIRLQQFYNQCNYCIHGGPEGAAQAGYRGASVPKTFPGDRSDTALQSPTQAPCSSKPRLFSDSAPVAAEQPMVLRHV